MFEHTGRQADTLDEPAFSQAGLTHENNVLVAADEVALGQGLDLHTRDGGIERPVEGGERQGFTEAGVLDEPFDAALAAQAGLIGEQSVQEVEMREACILGVLERRVELLGGDGDAECGEVGEDLVTPVWRCRRFCRARLRGLLGTGFHRRVPQVRASADSRWWGEDR